MAIRDTRVLKKHSYHRKVQVTTVRHPVQAMELVQLHYDIIQGEVKGPFISNPILEDFSGLNSSTLSASHEKTKKGNGIDPK